MREASSELCHRLKVPLTSRYGTIGVADLGNGAAGGSLLIPWDQKAKTLKLDIAGYRAERVRFIVKP